MRFAPRVLIRGLTGDGLLHRIHLSCGLRNRDVGLEPGDAEVIVIAFDFRKLIGGPAEGDKGFQGLAGAAEAAKEFCTGQREACRQYADDGVRVAIERNGTSDDVGIGGEAATPETFGEENDMVPRLLFRRQKCAAEDGLHTEERKKIRGVLGDADLLRLGATERQRFCSDGGEALEGLCVLPPIEKMVGVDGEIAEAVRAGVNLLAHDDELLRLRVVRHAEQHVAHDGKHDDVGADAEGEGKKSGRAESRAAA